MQELDDYDRTETYTRPGLAYSVVSLKDSTLPANVPEAFYQARKKISDEAKNLPDGVIGPLVNDEFSDVTFALFALKAKGEPQRLLVRDAENLRQQLLHVPGVKKVNIIGEQAERIFVSFSHDRLATLGVSPLDIFQALSNQNLLTPARLNRNRWPAGVYPRGWRAGSALKNPRYPHRGSGENAETLRCRRRRARV